MNKPSLPTLPTSPTLPTLPSLPTFQISLKHQTLKCRAILDPTYPIGQKKLPPIHWPSLENRDTQ